MNSGDPVTDQHRADARLIWDYHQMKHQLRPCSAGIGLGSHDLGVATLAADLYHAGLFPVLVFSGGNSPTTAARFPRGEAVHYAEHAMALGVPRTRSSSNCAPLTPGRTSSSLAVRSPPPGCLSPQ